MEVVSFLARHFLWQQKTSFSQSCKGGFFLCVTKAWTARSRCLLTKLRKNTSPCNISGKLCKLSARAMKLVQWYTKQCLLITSKKMRSIYRRWPDKSKKTREKGSPFGPLACKPPSFSKPYCSSRETRVCNMMRAWTRPRAPAARQAACRGSPGGGGGGIDSKGGRKAMPTLLGK